MIVFEFIFSTSGLARDDSARASETCHTHNISRQSSITPTLDVPLERDVVRHTWSITPSRVNLFFRSSFCGHLSKLLATKKCLPRNGIDFMSSVLDRQIFLMCERVRQ